MSDSAQTEVAYIGVGSNIDPQRNIEEGLKHLLEFVTVLDVSTHFSSSSTERPEQPVFVNGVWKIETERDARSLKFEVLREVERLLGRRRGTDKFAPRTLDLDLLLLGTCVIRSPELTLPDPDIYSAPYIAVPLAELSPRLILPDKGEAVGHLESAHAKEGLVPLPDFTRLLKGWVMK